MLLNWHFLIDLDTIGDALILRADISQAVSALSPVEREEIVAVMRVGKRAFRGTSVLSLELESLGDDALLCQSVNRKDFERSVDKMYRKLNGLDD